VIRVLIVDDQELVRAGFRLLLETEDGVQVVGEAGDGLDALDAVARSKPDVVLMDVRMPGLDGIEATRRIADRHPDTRVVMLTTFDLDEYVYDALRGGASGFLLKDAPAAQLIEAIRVVARGEALLAPSITRRLIERISDGDLRGEEPTPPELGELTPREREVLELMAQGLSNAEIATRLVVGDTTVKTHVARVLMKLGLRDRVQAVVLAYESGLVRPGAS